MVPSNLKAVDVPETAGKDGKTYLLLICSSLRHREKKLIA
jgi:hypothetical protein